MSNDVIVRNFATVNTHLQLEGARIDDLIHGRDAQNSTINQLQQQIQQLQVELGLMRSIIHGNGPTAT